MASIVSYNVEGDERRGFVARYHEESHLNRYYHLLPPSVTLTPEYCCPEKCSLLPKYKRRIILTLDHPDLDRIKE